MKMAHRSGQRVDEPMTGRNSNVTPPTARPNYRRQSEGPRAERDWTGLEQEVVVVVERGVVRDWNSSERPCEVGRCRKTTEEICYEERGGRTVYSVDSCPAFN